MGDAVDRRRDEAVALLLGLELGMTVVDTAEICGDGATESVLREALAGVVRSDQVLAIPKSAVVFHVRESREALDITLSEQDLAHIDAEYPPPRRASRLEML